MFHARLALFMFAIEPCQIIKKRFSIGYIHVCHTQIVSHICNYLEETLKTLLSVSCLQSVLGEPSFHERSLWHGSSHECAMKNACCAIKHHSWSQSSSLTTPLSLVLTSKHCYSRVIPFTEVGIMGFAVFKDFVNKINVQ